MASPESPDEVADRMVWAYSTVLVLQGKRGGKELDGPPSHDENAGFSEF